MLTNVGNIKTRQPVYIPFRASQFSEVNGHFTSNLGTKTILTRSTTEVQIQNERKWAEKIRLCGKRKVESKDSYGNNRKRWQESDTLKKSSDCARETAIW